MQARKLSFEKIQGFNPGIPVGVPVVAGIAGPDEGMVNAGIDCVVMLNAESLAGLVQQEGIFHPDNVWCPGRRGMTVSDKQFFAENPGGYQDSAAAGKNFPFPRASG